MKEIKVDASVEESEWKQKLSNKRKVWGKLAKINFPFIIWLINNIFAHVLFIYTSDPSTAFPFLVKTNCSRNIPNKTIHLNSNNVLHTHKREKNLFILFLTGTTLFNNNGYSKFKIHTISYTQVKSENDIFLVRVNINLFI